MITDEAPTKATLLLVSNSIRFVVSHRLEVVREAARSGMQVLVAAPLDDRGAVAILDGVGASYIKVDVSRGFLNCWKDLLAVRSLVRVLSEREAVILHAVTLKGIVVGGLAARISGCRNRVYAVAGFGYAYTRAGIHALFARFTFETLFKIVTSGRGRVALIVQNRDDRRIVGRLVRANDHCRVVQLPGSGVDLTVFSPSIREASSRVVVVLAARMLADKGVREFVQAAKVLRQRGLDVEFVLAGGVDHGNPSAIPDGEIDLWVRSGLVSWLGHVRDMAGLYRYADIACLPSYREGMPKSLLEAAACGLPVVTTDAPGCREAVLDGRTGFLVPVRDAEGLANAIEKLARSKELRNQMGREARLLAESRFGVETVVNKTLSLYRWMTDDANGLEEGEG